MVHQLPSCVCVDMPLFVGHPQERVRAQELAMRERETQELLKSGVAGTRRGTSRPGNVGGPAYNKALAQNVAAEKVQVYGQAFERIQQATGIEDIEQLVSGFISAEDQNYTLFNYVNEVSRLVVGANQHLATQSELRGHNPLKCTQHAGTKRTHTPAGEHGDREAGGPDPGDQGRDGAVHGGWSGAGNHPTVNAATD